MSGENAVSADRSSAEEIALARAATNNAANSDVNPTGILYTALANQVAPTAVVLAAGTVTAPVNGVGILFVTLQYTTSGAGTVALTVTETAGATVSGGTVPSSSSNWRYNGGAITVTGGSSPSSLGVYTKTSGAAALEVMTVAIPVAVLSTAPVTFVIAVTTSLSLSAMQINTTLDV